MTPNDVTLLKDSYIEYMKKFEGTFYTWGGNDPSSFDCSGYIIEGLKSVGLLPRKVDYTSDQLYQMFKKYEVSVPYEGCLIFWVRSGKSYHVETAINKYQMIGASGGGSDVKTRQDAIKKNAFIKRRPIPQTSNLVFVDIFQVLSAN